MDNRPAYLAGRGRGRGRGTHPRTQETQRPWDQGHQRRWKRDDQNNGFGRQGDNCERPTRMPTDAPNHEAGGMCWPLITIHQIYSKRFDLLRDFVRCSKSRNQI